MNYIAFLFTAASIVGTLANSFQKKWCFGVWICTNSFWCVYNTINGQYAQALLYVFNFITCVIGLWKWKNPNTKRNEENNGKTIVLPETKDGFNAENIVVDEFIKETTEPEDPFERMAKAAAEFTSALVDSFTPVVKAFADIASRIAEVHFEANFGFCKWQQLHGNPKLIHRAYHSKKYRTRKRTFHAYAVNIKKYIKKGGKL